MVVTGYEKDLEKINRILAELTPSDIEQTTGYLYSQYQRASLTGCLGELRKIREAINAALGRVGPWPDICLLKANLDFKLHRLAATKEDLALAPGLSESFDGRVLLAEVGFQEGRYAEAMRAYEALIEQDRTWENLARLAYVKAKWGETAEAERLYLDAQDEITAKDMRSYAWVELQRGLLDLQHGRYTEALAHYECAQRAYTGYWLIDEHTAEVLAALGKTDEAVELYLSVLQRAPKPEIQQTLGELYVWMGEADQAEPWFDRALAAYLESAERGEVHYYHHLADFYSEVRVSGPDAVNWARVDCELRPNYATQSALAFALYRDGQGREALATIRLALQSGVQDAHLFWQAAEIFEAAGMEAEAGILEGRASRINPDYHGFHVHR